MEFRYMGFDQTPARRLYHFDGAEGKAPAVHFIVNVELALFLKNHVRIQEGPSLCSQKLKADLDAQHQGEHELTSRDLIAYTEGRDAAAREAKARRSAPRHKLSGERRAPRW